MLFFCCRLHLGTKSRAEMKKFLGCNVHLFLKVCGGWLVCVWVWMCLCVFVSAWMCACVGERERARAREVRLEDLDTTPPTDKWRDLEGCCDWESCPGLTLSPSLARMLPD